MNRKLVIGILAILAVLAVVFAIARAQTSAPITMTPPQCTDATDGRECTSSGDLGAALGVFEFSGEATMPDGSKVTAGPGVFVKCGDLQARGEGNKLTLTWKCPPGAAISFSVKKK